MLLTGVVAALLATEQSTFAVKYAPGISAPVSFSDRAVGPASWIHSPGVEVRISRYFSVRADAELRRGASTFQVPGIKLSGMPDSHIHPWVSVSLALHQMDGADRVGVGLMKAVGLDVTLFKYVLLTGELRASWVPGDCCTLPRVAGLFGAGVQFL